MIVVYMHAIQVVVWLGPKTEGIELAFSLAERMITLRDLPPEAGKYEHLKVEM